MARQMMRGFRLRLFNLAMALLHTGQGIAILVLSNEATLPVRTSFLRFNEERQALETATRDVFDLQLAPLVASFLFISAIAHAPISIAASTTCAGGSTP